MIYFVDDEQSFCQIFKEYMTEFGYQTQVFMDHEQALQQLEQQIPDVVCVDYRLKGITGDELIKQVPDSVTKILITGELKYQNADLFDAHLNKPFRLQQLKTLIDETHAKKSS